MSSVAPLFPFLSLEWGILMDVGLFTSGIEEDLWEMWLSCIGVSHLRKGERSGIRIQVWDEQLSCFP